MADAVIGIGEATSLSFQFSKNGVVSAVPTVTATQTDSDGTITNLSNPTLQNSMTDPAYVLDFSSMVEDDYRIKFVTSDSTCDQYPQVTFYVTVKATSDVDLSPVLDQLDLIQAKTDTIGVTSFQVISPVLSGGSLHIVAGDDYKLIDSRQLPFEFVSAPDLTDSVVTLRVAENDNDITLGESVTGTVVDATNIYFEPTAIITRDWFRATRFEIQAVLSNGNIQTLISLDTGTVTVDPQAV